MELELNCGKYVPAPWGGLKTVNGQQEKIQRIMMRLAACRGCFAPMPDYGSRLYTLPGLKPSARAAAARQFVHEALEDESGIEIESVDCTELPGGLITVSVALSLSGESVGLSFTV